MILCITAQVITVLNGVIHCLLGYLLSFRELPAKEQPLPPSDSPTTESPGYVTESDPEEDPEEYEDDETEDGPVDYPMDGGDEEI
ncbi:hypothetical protein Tco_0597958 [Tanacetum coccineum]